MSNLNANMGIIFHTNADDVRRDLEEVRTEAKEKGIEINVRVPTEQVQGARARGERVRVGQTRDVYSAPEDPWARLDAPYARNRERRESTIERRLTSALETGLFRDVARRDRTARDEEQDRVGQVRRETRLQSSEFRRELSEARLTGGTRGQLAVVERELQTQSATVEQHPIGSEQRDVAWRRVADLQTRRANLIDQVTRQEFSMHTQQERETARGLRATQRESDQRERAQRTVDTRVQRAWDLANLAGQRRDESQQVRDNRDREQRIQRRVTQIARANEQREQMEYDIETGRAFGDGRQSARPVTAPRQPRTAHPLPATLTGRYAGIPVGPPAPPPVQPRRPRRGGGGPGGRGPGGGGGGRGGRGGGGPARRFGAAGARGARRGLGRLFSRGGFFGAPRLSRLTRYLSAGAIAYEGLRVAEAYREYNASQLVAGNDQEAKLKGEIAFRRGIEGIPLIGQTASFIVDPTGAKQAGIDITTNQATTQDAQTALRRQQQLATRNVRYAAEVGTQRDPYQRRVQEADIALQKTTESLEASKNEVTTANAKARKEAIDKVTAETPTADLTTRGEGGGPGFFRKFAGFVAGSAVTFATLGNDKLGHAVGSAIEGPQDNEILKARRDREKRISDAYTAAREGDKKAEDEYNKGLSEAQRLRDFEEQQAHRERKTVQIGHEGETKATEYESNQQGFEAATTRITTETEVAMRNAAGTGQEAEIAALGFQRLAKATAEMKRNVKLINTENVGQADIADLEGAYKGREAGVAGIRLKYDLERQQADKGALGQATIAGINKREASEESSFTKRFDDAENLYLEGLKRNRQVVEQVAQGREKSARAEQIQNDAIIKARGVDLNPDIKNKREAKREIFATAEAEEKAYARELKFESVGVSKEVAAGTTGPGFFGTRSRLQENPFDALKTIPDHVAQIHQMVLANMGP